MFEELGGDVFVNMIFGCELDRDSHQVERKHSHPAGGVALFEACSIRKHRVAIEHADVIEPEKTALENVFAFGSLPFTHQVKAISILWKIVSKNARSPLPVCFR